MKYGNFNATCLSTNEFSTLSATLHHNLFKDKLIDLIEKTFQRECPSYLACNDRNALFTSEQLKNIMHGRVYDVLTFLLDNIFFVNIPSGVVFDCIDS